MMRRVVLCLAAIMMVGAGSSGLAGPDTPWQTIIAGEQTEPERLATIDLQRYLGQVTGETPVVLSPQEWRSSPRPGVAVGTAATNSLIRQTKSMRRQLGEQGYRLEQRMIAGTTVVVAAGATAEGAVNAVYGLLRELGYGFYLGSEALPASLPDRLDTARTVPTPALRVRGVLPWYNFFNSPTAWDPVDHRGFVDQLIRSGANFLGYHTYDSEPFAAYEDEGKMKWGQRLLDTGSPTWGTKPMQTKEFAGGTDKLFANEFFGAETTRITSETEAIQAEQDVMRDALDYAHRRGLHTCIGFEVTGDPTLPEDREVFVRRLRHLLLQYPTVDYVWIWQPEAQGAQGYNIRPTLLDGRASSSTLPLYATARSDVFSRVVDPANGEGGYLSKSDDGRFKRAAEAARLEQYGQLASRILRQHTSPPRLVISGWGGDDRLLSAEYYEGLDRLLPRDVVFSSLDYIIPRPRVDAIYHELPSSRERWPIPWLEYDGDQWHPQPYVHIYEGILRETQRGGSQGILGIHWRTRDIEENFAYMIDAAWQPGLTALGFFADYARRCYAPEIAEEMAAIHAELDKLNYRWIGGGGQNECAPFSWGAGEQGKRAALEDLCSQAKLLLPSAGRTSPRLQWLISRMDWVLDYQAAEESATSASALLARARDSRTSNAKELAVQAIDLLDNDLLAKALHSYSRRLTTRGEYGVLATINTKAVAEWRRMRSESGDILGSQVTSETVAAWQPEPGVVMPRFLGSAPAGRELELEPVVLGGGPAWLHYRPVGAIRWESKPLETLQGWVRRGVVPAEAVRAPGLEVAFSFDASAAQKFALGPLGVTVMPDTAVTSRRSEEPPPDKVRLNLRSRRGGTMPVELSWNEIDAAVCYRVWRNDIPVAETAVAFFPDCPREKRATYRVEAIRDGKVIGRSSERRINVAALPVTERVRLSARATRSGIVVRWPATRPPNTTSYSLTLLPAQGKGEALVREIPADRRQAHVILDTPPPGRWTYRVVPIGFSGKKGRAVSATLEFPPPDMENQELRLSLSGTPSTGTVEGRVDFGEEGARFGNGAIVIPHGAMMDMEFGMTLEFEFKAESISELPVLMSCGFWQTDGWFVQILGGRLIIRTPGGDAHGPQIEPGRWYWLKWVYDGRDQRLFVDGKEIPQSQVNLSTVPSHRSLVIGHYEHREPRYAFDGTIRNVRITSGLNEEGI